MQHKPNQNTIAGISYGLISLAACKPSLLDRLIELPNPALDEALVAFARDALREKASNCQAVRQAIANLSFTDPATGGIRQAIADLPEPDLLELLEQHEPRALNDFYVSVDMYMVGAKGIIDGVMVQVTEFDGVYHLWVYESPHSGHYAECSPRAPGAGDLETPDPNGPRTYDVPQEWRR